MKNENNYLQSPTGLYGLANSTDNTTFTDSLAKDSTKIGYTIARALMTKVYGNLYNEVLIKSGPSGGGSRFADVNNELLNTIQIFPNPANNLLNAIVYLKAEDKSTAIVTITNMIGKTMLNQNLQVNNGLVQIALTDMSTGMYILNIETNVGNKLTGKFTIQR